MTDRENEHISLIYTKMLTHLYIFGFRFTADRERIMDCIHDVFLKLCEYEDITAIGCLESYLYRALKNRLLNELQRKQTENYDENLHDKELEISSEAQFIEDEEAQQLSVCMAKSLESLTPRQHEAIRLYYLEQRSYEEASEKMGVDKQQVRNFIYQAMKRLRETCDESIKLFLKN